ncbi:MAG: hypothetical protein VX238_12825, partial [Pseudomonadota bacterium]|nr:hypothetical protein [Pseudomonadota bacterium]
AGVDKSDDDMFAALRKVALQEDSWNKALSNYSKGMRQKTAIAFACSGPFRSPISVQSDH